jgi:hypothetical protein
MQNIQGFVIRSGLYKFKKLELLYFPKLTLKSQNILFLIHNYLYKSYIEHKNNMKCAPGI